MKPGLAEEQNYSPLGAPGHAPVRTPGPAHGIDLHLRRNLPGLGRHGRPGPALVQHRGNGAAPGRDRQAHRAGHITPGKHCALLVDQAGWHMSKRLAVPANITVVPLPAKCPELSPIENVCQFMRNN